MCNYGNTQSSRIASPTTVGKPTLVQSQRRDDYEGWVSGSVPSCSPLGMLFVAVDTGPGK